MHRRWCSRLRSCGRSLLEIMAVLGVLSALAGAAAPSIARLVARYQQQAALSALYSHLSMARQTAVAKGQRITMRAAPAGWHQGWEVFADTNPNGLLDEGETVLAVGEARRVHISARGPMAEYVSFDPGGWPVQANGAFLSGRFVICSPGDSHTHLLVMSAAGRIRQERTQGHCP